MPAASSPRDRAATTLRVLGKSPPRGTLVAIGGAEDKEGDMTVLRQVLSEVKGAASRVEVIAGASREPREAARAAMRAFGRMGVAHVGYVPMQARSEAEDAHIVERLDQADAIYFTGGDQARLVETMLGTPALDAVRRRYRAGAVVAGTSAGAAAMSETMLAGGRSEAPLVKGNVEMKRGFGLLPHAVIDTHFLQRGRFNRLLEVVSHTPHLAGIGISEDTGIIVRGGRHVEVVGADSVVVMDGTEILHTNTPEAAHGDALVVTRAIVHVLVAGCRYDLQSRAPQLHAPPPVVRRR